MKIAIIGTGNVGGTLAKKWAQKGHTISLGVRNPNDFKGNQLLEQKNISAMEVSEAVANSAIVLIATPAKSAVEVAKSLGETEGKVIIDAMNIIKGNGPEGYSNTADAILDHTDSGHVVKCFNTTGFNNMDNPNYDNVSLDLFTAGNSIEGKQLARQLALDAGFADCYDVGGNEMFQLMEQFAWFWINMAMQQGFGREIGFKLLKL